MNRMPRYLAPIVAVAMLAGCGVKQSIADAEAEVGRFHSALDAGQFAAIWNTTGPQFRAATSEAEFDKMLEAVHRKLGKVKQSKQVGWNANATTGGTFIRVSMQTRFERGSGTESFVYTRDAGQHLRLAGYNIDSQDMMLN